MIDNISMSKLKTGSIVLDTLQPVVLAFAIFMMIYMFLFQPHKVDGNSMYPNFHNQEYILTDKITYRKRDPQRGEVIVFHAPPPNNADFIKRIIGLPGESIMVQNGRVYINGKQLPEIYLPISLATTEKSFLREGVSYTIPAGYYIVLGDNRNYSSDSREWGPVSRKAIVGKAIFRYWPPKSGVFGLIPHQNYTF
jgi:signal peptidase I